MSLSERLFNFIKHKGYSINGFEKEIGVSTGMIAKAVKDDRSIGTDKLLKIFLKCPDINLHWLITGEGLMYRNESDNTILQEPSALYNMKHQSRLEQDVERYTKEIDMLYKLLEKEQAKNK